MVAPATEGREGSLTPPPPATQPRSTAQLTGSRSRELGSDVPPDGASTTPASQPVTGTRSEARATSTLAGRPDQPRSVTADGPPLPAAANAGTPGHAQVSPGPAQSTGTNLQWIDVDRIRPNRFQPRTRFPEEELEELAASIRSTGILQPIIVRREGPGFGLVAGERRWRAAQRAGLLKVPALVRDIPDDRLLETALIENIQRQELNPIEEARAYATLIEKLGLTQAEVAERVGRERSSIANFLRLLSISPKVQTLVEEGILTMGHARTLAGLPTHRGQELGAEIIAKRGMSVREAEAWARRHTEDPPEPRPRPRADPNVAAAEETLQRLLGTRVRILPGRGEKGQIWIEYYSSAELDRLYNRLTKQG